MKKKKLFQYAATAICLGVALNVNAQTLWTVSGGGGVTTTTTGECTVGLKLNVEGGVIEMPMASPTALRHIRGLAGSSALGLYSNTGPTDGSNVEVFGDGHSTFKGEVHFNTFTQTGWMTSVWGHVFQNCNYDPGTTTASWSQSMGIAKNGQIVMSDNLSSVATHPGDILTVKNSIGFHTTTDPIFRGIHGNTYAGSVGMYATRFSDDGAGIEAFGAGHAAFPGAVHAASYGNIGGTPEKAFSFVNYTPSTSTYHTNISITKRGEMIIAEDRSIADIAAGDVLTVKDQIGYFSTNPNSDRNLNGNAPAGALKLHNNTTSSNGPSIEMFGGSYPGAGSVADFTGRIHYTAFGNKGYGHLFQSYDAGWHTAMGITNDGRVIIGDGLLAGGTVLDATNAPSGYSLYVSKGIITEKLKVANSSDPLNWADFVFNKDYKLMPLHKVEAYIKANRHLPEIPSAEEVAKEGIDVAAMDAKLLQKIEELTLYVIEQQKQLQLQQKEIELLKKSNN